jgi:hypothetical protein
MKQLIIVAAFIAGSLFSFAQGIDRIINKDEVEKIEKVLSANDMEGRKAGSPGNERAADFIAAEFKKAGLQTWNNSNSYLQYFSMVQPRFIGLTCSFDQQPVNAKDVVVFTSQPALTVTEQSGYEKKTIAAGNNLFAAVIPLIQSGKNYLVLVDPSYSNAFARLTRLKRMLFKSPGSVVLVLTDKNPSTYRIEAQHSITEQKLMNVVGILPGKSRKDEYVIFSGHFDHLGIADKPEQGDSVYNGANDDAAGTTAVIMLARYFKALGNNERTIIFAAFNAEEIGGFGSQYFSQQFDPAKVMAMFNIEMIGTESKWGRNSAYITGFEKTDMGKILSKNLEGSGFTFYPDPYTEQQLFYRSDNATLARLGVPAHTISTSKMDNEPNYHKLSDEIGTLDMSNMAAIIKAIALSSTSIIKGTDTPSRVNTAELK